MSGCKFQEKIYKELASVFIYIWVRCVQGIKTRATARSLVQLNSAVELACSSKPGICPWLSTLRELRLFSEHCTERWKEGSAQEEKLSWPIHTQRTREKDKERESKAAWKSERQLTILTHKAPEVLRRVTFLFSPVSYLALCYPDCKPLLQPCPDTSFCVGSCRDGDGD